MIENFRNKADTYLEESINIGKLSSSGNLTREEVTRLEDIKTAWNFYEGYHWEGIEETDSPQLTFNYCRVFVNKFVSFELGSGVTRSFSSALEDREVTVNDPINEKNKDSNDDGYIDADERSTDKVRQKTLLEFVNEVWSYNNEEELLIELGQAKSITGEAWVKVDYDSPEELDDPFQKYPNGKITIDVIPTQYVFPTFNPHNNKKVDTLLIMYPIQKTENVGLLKRSRTKIVVYKEYWTKDTIEVYEDKTLIDSMTNPYGTIPFVQIKNFPVAGRSHGVSDLEDLIPLNVELNTKRSDVSEVIDYHSAPVTLVYGAKIGNLEKGANKVWGGLPKDSKVENLQMQGDLIASTTYINTLKTALCEIGGVPETILGGASAISNTSGVALQYMNLPLIDKTKIKRSCTKNGLEDVNRLIIMVALSKGLIVKPEDVSLTELYYNEVTLPDTLPKDTLIELQQIETEMKLGLESREGAMKRLGKEDIQTLLAKIDAEREAHPEIFNPMLQQTMLQNELNSGMTNGQTNTEEVRKEITGQNGGASVINTPQ